MRKDIYDTETYLGKPLYKVTKPKNLRDVIKTRLKEFPDNPVFLVKEKKGGEYVPISTEKYDHDIDSLGTALMHYVPKGSRVAILSETRYEWYTSYLATTNGTGCVVPLDKELKAEEIESMLNRAEVDILIFSKTKKDVVEAVYGKIPTMKYWISMDDTDDERFVSYSKFIKEGEDLLASGDKTFTETSIDPEEMTVLLFTSGTTAKSKAVMLCQRNICKNLISMFSMLYIDVDDVFFSVLPLHHTYECTCGFLGQVYRGTTISVCEGLRYIAQNLQEAKPTCVLMVPVMLEMFYKKIMKGINADPKKAKKLKTGIKLSKFLLKFGIDVRKKLFKQIHDIFGGRMRLIILGGAPVNPEILTFFQDMGFLCVQGYGLTECAPILALNRDIAFKNQAAGLPLPGCDVKILNPDEDGIGEFIAKGDNVFMGYYKDPENTSAALDADGYYHTGDLGYIDEDHFCIITGRKKNVIIAKNGKNVFPEEIEYLLSLSPYVCESVISGVEDEARDDIIIKATIFPEMEEVTAKLGEDPTEDAITELLKEVVSETNEKLPNYKKIKKVELRMTEFEKNTSKKIKRY
ncbi:MAG: AMP-binding protein [Clostridiales bacterium]|nr:AMP-binding protein [Clostridiales bacterium]